MESLTILISGLSLMNILAIGSLLWKNGKWTGRIEAKIENLEVKVKWLKERWEKHLDI